MSNDKVAYCGLVTVVPNDYAVSTKQSGGTTSRHEMTYRDNNYNKQTGSYERVTAKESFSSGDYSNRGKAGYKNEYQTSTTVRVGDKGGYTEYYKQEKYTRVDYGGGSSNSSSSGGSKGYNNYGGGNKGYKNSGGGGKKYLY